MNLKFDLGNLASKVWNWLQGFSEVTLSLSAITVLHIVFLPNLVAYLNGLTDKLPNLDTYLLLLLALAIMNLRAIIKKDSIATIVHAAGFISQLVVLAVVLLK